ncbi:EamA/RhaT family transporter [Kocuria coralli]|uniref:EamA/RhaT family transporter n=1 Tax=Kocuria coralli TaxID=1461025 RepID=A0A5J5KX60_9MICC|nr:EamA family transporter [Kocuria coralli]KAA9394263.1 EamA/RhaT family transporter [Kocuria coralli]
MSAAGSTAGILAVFITAVLWGTTGTAATFAPEVSPIAIGSAAMGIGGLLQALIALPALRRDRSVLSGNMGLVAVGAFAVVVYPLTFYSSMHLAGVAIGTVVSLASAPLASGVLELLLDRRRLSPRWIAAAGLGITGSTLLCVAKAAQPSASAAETLAGIGLGLLAGASYALYSWAVHRLLGQGAARGSAMGSVFGLGGLMLLPVLLVTGGPLLDSPGNLAVGAYMAVVPMFLGYLLFGVGLTRVRPSTATTITLSEPAVAALLAIVVVGERLSLLGWTGLAVLALALGVLATGRRTS